MIEESSKCRKALATTLAILVGAVIQRSLVSRTTDMLVKALSTAKLAMTDVALIAAAIVSRFGVPSRAYGVVVVPFEQAFGDNAAGIALTKDLMDDIARQVPSFGAGRGFQMMRNTTSSYEGSLAKGTDD